MASQKTEGQGRNVKMKPFEGSFEIGQKNSRAAKFKKVEPTKPLAHNGVSAKRKRDEN